MTRPTRITWLATRPDYHSAPKCTAVSGIACLAFGIGEAGAGWIARLRRSRWFDGLAPSAQDLALSGGHPEGSWTMPSLLSAPGVTVAAAVEALVRCRLPHAAVATIAVAGRPSPEDRLAACHLVTALHGAMDAQGPRPAVVVTLEGDDPPATDAFTRTLLDHGAFVIHAGRGAAGDHVHHFPLRCATMPRRGNRLISVDLADYLACWPDGCSAKLHSISCISDAELTFRTISAPSAGGGSRAFALNLHLHTDTHDTTVFLTKIDRLATACRTRFLRPDGPMVFTYADRWDGVVAAAELLIVHDGPSAATTSASVVDEALCIGGRRTSPATPLIRRLP